MADKLEGYFRDHETQIHRDILRLVSIPSVSEDRAGARRALDEFLTMAESMGFTVKKVAEGDVGVASLGPEIPGPCETLGILAHVDVVDPGDASAWSRSPWGELADGAVWGRGTLDDKGPLVVCLWAVKALKDLGVRFRKRVSFIVGTMEEIDWKDIRQYLKEENPPDFGFTPDGEFPVINREKGYCDVELSFDRKKHGALGEYEIESLEAGVSVNVVPDSAQVRLRRPSSGAGGSAAEALSAILDGLPEALKSSLRIESQGDKSVVVRARGQAVHSSVPERGSNALTKLASFLSLLGRNGLVDMLVENFIQDFNARSLGLQTRPEYVRGEYLGPTSASPDLARTTEGEFVVSINLRLAFGQRREEISSVFDAARGRYGYTFSLSEYLPALFIPKDSPFMQALLSAYEGRTGLPGEFVLAPGTSYAKAMPKVAAFGPILPGHPDLCHETDERMSFEEVRTCALVYADAVAAVVTASETLA